MTIEIFKIYFKINGLNNWYEKEIADHYSTHIDNLLDK